MDFKKALQLVFGAGQPKPSRNLQQTKKKYSNVTLGGVQNAVGLQGGANALSVPMPNIYNPIYGPRLVPIGPDKQLVTPEVQKQEKLNSILNGRRFGGGPVLGPNMPRLKPIMPRHQPPKMSPPPQWSSPGFKDGLIKVPRNVFDPTTQLDLMTPRQYQIHIQPRGDLQYNNQLEDKNKLPFWKMHKLQPFYIDPSKINSDRRRFI